MALRRKFSVLRDPVHGDIYLTDEEIAVMDTAEFQRLRGVRQLGAAYLVYPGALHTRFEHSIGTVHVTQAMLDAIQRSHELDPRSSLGVSDQEARVIRMASLLHDVTHMPFGHNIEDQSGLLERHDSAARFEAVLSTGTEVGALLEAQGLRRDVLNVLLPEGAPGRDAVPPFWRQVLSDTICSDLLDYLARDAYFTGLRIQVDERVRSYFKIDRLTGNLFIDLAKRELLREDILSEVVRLLEARYYFSERVYYHHAKVAAGALIARAVELALDHKLVAPDALYQQTEDSLFELLLRSSAKAPRALSARIADLVMRVRRRRLYKRAAVFPRYQNQDVQDELVRKYFARGTREARLEVEARIADLVRFATGQTVEVIVYCPAARMQLKEAETHVRWPGEGAPRPLAEFSAKVPRLLDLERSYRDLWKFYVFADSSDPAVLGAVQRAAAEEFSAHNAYRVE